MTTYEIITSLIAFGALIISILAYGQGAVNHILSMTESTKANKTPERALDFALYQRRKDIVPEIKARLEIVYANVDDTNEYQISLRIENIGFSETTINRVTVGLVSGLKISSNNQYPFYLP